MSKLSRGYCKKTYKTRFPDVIAAKMALATITRDGRDINSSGKVPRRSYRCEFCSGYHLTSQSKREYQEQKTIAAQ